MFNKFFVCDDARLFEAVHSFYDSNVYKTVVVDYIQQVVFANYFLRDGGDVKLHVLWFREVVVQIKVFYICH